MCIYLFRTDEGNTRKMRAKQKHSAYLFWILISLLFILALGNLILTISILGVLRLGQGMESLELVPAESVIKFFGLIDLDNIYKRDGKLESFNDFPMEVEGDEGNVFISIPENEKEITSTINFDKKQKIIKNVDSFIVRNPLTGKTIFSTDFPNFGLPKGVGKLDVELVLTKRITSALDKILVIKSDSFVKLKGSEGIHIDGKEVIFSADQDIFLKSVNKSIILDGQNGVIIDVRNLPIASEKNPRTFTQYKICVCMPEGKLFRLAIPPGQSTVISCNNIATSSFDNPCTN